MPPDPAGRQGASCRGVRQPALLLTRNVSLVIPEGCGEGSQGCAVFRATPGRHNTRRSRPGRGAGNGRAQTHSMGATPTFGRTVRRFPAPLPRCEFSKLYLVQGCAEYRDPWLPSWRPSRTPPRGEPLPRQTRKFPAISPEGSGCLTLRVRSRASEARHRFSARGQAAARPRRTSSSARRLATLVVVRKQSGVALRLPPHSREVAVRAESIFLRSRKRWRYGHITSRCWIWRESTRPGAVS